MWHISSKANSIHINILIPELVHREIIQGEEKGISELRKIGWFSSAILDKISMEVKNV